MEQLVYPVTGFRFHENDELTRQMYHDEWTERGAYPREEGSALDDNGVVPYWK
jgi:hypothetical protein